MAKAFPRIDETRLPMRKPAPCKEWRGVSCPDHTANVPDISEDEIELRFRAALLVEREKSRQRRLSSTAIYP